MNPLVPLVERLAAGFNDLPLWAGECTVWDRRFRSASFERWLYLRLHRLGWMGRRESAALARSVRPGMTVLDVGGNLGLYTLLLSRLVGPAGRVVTFEPDPALFALLRHNIARNGCANIEAHNLALGRTHARLRLRRLILNSGDNTLGPGGSGWFRREVEVEVVALDEFRPGWRPDFVKIDVQGWELDVLRGMEQSLAAEPPPILHLEYWPAGFRRAGYAARDLVAFLRARRFRLHRVDTGAELDEAGLAQLDRELTGLRHADIRAER
ncbi:MAG TPA: FkbM family methyltransferase [Lacunisphaera sp.]|nr:FkbM family methyltransferase [Lacunisphaera sp.]